MDRQRHWNERYSTTPIERLGWYRNHLERSLRWIDDLDLARDSAIIDVGAGASTLVDDLLQRGFTDLSALDVSGEALAIARKRLGDKARQVDWLLADVTSADLADASIDLWHDRAVFHFLIDQADRDRYLETLRRCLRPGGHVLIGVFSPDAPPKCSGLPVQRYTLDELKSVFEGVCDLIDESRELHVTPGGIEQPYVYALLKRRDEG